jgi:hypothetical protein
MTFIFFGWTPYILVFILALISCKLRCIKTPMGRTVRTLLCIQVSITFLTFSSIPFIILKNYRCTGQCRIFSQRLLCVIKIISVYFIMKKIIDAQDSAEFFSQKIYQCRIIFIKTPVRIFLLCVYFFLVCGLSKRYCAICHTQHKVIYNSDICIFG